MRVLFVHQNFPAQFRDLAPALAARAGHEVVFLTQAQEGELRGVRRTPFGTRRPTGASGHRYLRDLERSMLVGQGA